MTSAPTTTITAKPSTYFSESYRRDADFTELGSKMSRFFLRNALVARLLSEASWKQSPARRRRDRAPDLRHRSARTGTTACTGCCAATPPSGVSSCGWPSSPAAPAANRGRQSGFRRAGRAIQEGARREPDYTGSALHDRRRGWRSWQLLRQSLHSLSHETLAHVPTYAQWLARQDWTRPYQRHRKNLQLIRLNDPEKRWVLKNQKVTCSPSTLFATYPGRPCAPVPPSAETIMASMCSLAQHTTEAGPTRSSAPPSADCWRPGRAGWSGSMPFGANMIRRSSYGVDALPADPRPDPHGRGDLRLVRHRG